MRQELVASRSLRHWGWLVSAAVALAACDDEGDVSTPPTVDASVDAPVDAPVDASADVVDAPSPLDAADAPTPVDASDTRQLVMRRLGRAEYVNTVRDLLADYELTGRELPADQIGYLFFNIGRTQTLARLDIERYLQVAEGVIDRAWATRGAASRVLRPGFEGLETTFAPGFDGPAVRVDGSVDPYVRLGDNDLGAVRIQLRLQPQAAPAGRLDLDVVQDEQVLATADVTSSYPSGAEFSFYVPVQWRARPIPNPGPRLTLRLRGASSSVPVMMGLLRVTTQERLPEQRLDACDPNVVGVDACLRAIFTPFARRAWRRPLAADDVDRLVALARSRMAAGDSFDAAARAALTAVLVSPRFLFRVETSSGATPTARDPYELATALSYFLWASMPDEALRAAADSGAILRTDEIERQVRRMVADARFEGFVRSFVGQWLSFNGAAPDTVTTDLRNVARPEVESTLFFDKLFRDNAPLRDVFVADWTYLDAATQLIYGLRGSQPGDRFALASLTGLPRMGYLTQAGFLSATSQSSQTTQPTVRGYFLLARLMCAAPDPPPRAFDNFVMKFEQGTELAMSGTFRQVLEAHRANPECAGCHAVMDPLGIAFENYDVRGNWRTEAMGRPIDAASMAEGFGSFQSALELIPRLPRDPRLPACMVNHLMTYALGRGDLDPAADGVDDVVTRFNAQDQRLLDLLVAVATSQPFRTRAAQGAP